MILHRDKHVAKKGCCDVFITSLYVLNYKIVEARLSHGGRLKIFEKNVVACKTHHNIHFKIKKGARFSHGGRVENFLKINLGREKHVSTYISKIEREILTVGIDFFSC